MQIRGARVVLSLILSIALCGAVAGARADTIVLKSGRRIAVERATESGDRIVGETAAGEISLPKSMVDRIEHTPVATSAVVASDRTTSAGFVIAPPATQTELSLDPEVAHAAVHDGFIDKVYISKLDGAAISGAPGSASRAAAAHYAAAEFETQKGNLSGAVDQERQALRFLPNSVPLLVGAAYGHLKLSEYSTALEYLTRAKRSAPDSPDVAKLSGWAEYGLNHIPEAVQEWKRAQQLRPDPEVAKALEKAERDARAENDFRQGQTSHFVLRYSGAAQPGLATDILGTLEIHFEQIASLLEYTPPEPIGVILYTNEQFEDITRAPAWAGAINDGRLRIPVQGLSSVTQPLSLVLRHELTHSFLQQKTRGRCPPWLHEGVAQWIEGRRVGPAAVGLLAAYDHQAGIPLTDLEVSWMSLSGTGASFAYGWSLAVVETIIASNSMADLVRILDALTASGSTEGTVRSILHMSYTELEQQTADYLRSTYGRN